jgi:hypothetical protein
MQREMELGPVFPKLHVHFLVFFCTVKENIIRTNAHEFLGPGELNPGEESRKKEARAPT